MSSINGVSSVGAGQFIEAKRADSPRSLAPGIAQRVLAAAHVSPLTQEIARGVVGVKFIDPYHDSISFKRRFELYIELINQEFNNAQINFTDEQIAILESLSKFPLFELRPLAETVGVSLFQDFKKLRDRVGELGYPDKKVKLIREMLDKLSVTHECYRWIESVIELDQDDPDGKESSEGLAQDLLPALDQMEKCLSDISKSLLPAGDAIALINEMKAKISIMKSMIKLDRNDSGKIFWLTLGEFSEGVDKIMEKRSLLDLPKVEVLSGAIDSESLKQEYQKYAREITEDQFVQYLSDLLEWQTPAYKDCPEVETRLAEIKKQIQSLPENFEEVNNFLEETLKRWKSDLEKIGKYLSKAKNFGPDPVFSPYDLEGISAYTQKYIEESREYSLKKAQSLVLAIRFVMNDYFGSKDQEIRKIKFQATLRSFFDALERFRMNSGNELYSDFSNLMDDVFLKRNQTFMKEALAYIKKEKHTKYEDFCKKTNFQFAKPSFINQLMGIHKKYSLRTNGLKQDDADQLRKDYTTICLEFANLFLLVQIVNNEKRKQPSEIHLESFFKGLPEEFLDRLKLDDLPQPQDQGAVVEAASPTDPQVGVLTIEDGSPDQLSLPPILRREKVKTRRGVPAPDQVLEGPKQQEPELQGLEYRFRDLNLPSSGEIKREEALQLLRAYFGGIEVVEGGSHSKVKLKGGGFVAVPRHDTFATALIAQSVKKVLRQREKKKDS